MNLTRSNVPVAIALSLCATILAIGCSYTPTREDFTNPPDWLDRTTDPPTLWYRDTTDQGYSYMYSYHANALDICRGHRCCTMPDGRSVVMAPAYFWRGQGGARQMAFKHEECHVNAIQSGDPDRCDS